MMKKLLKPVLCFVAGACLMVGSADATLVHHFDIEGDTAGTLTDSVGGKHLAYTDSVDGTLGNASAIAPGTGSTQGFETAVGGEAHTANADDLFMASSYSLSLWTKRISASGLSAPAMLGVYENGGGYEHNYLIRSLPDGTLLSLFTRDNSGTNNVINPVSSVLLDDNEWHHIAATFDWSGVSGTAAVGKIYVDGVETGSDSEASWSGWTAANQTNGGIGQDTFTPNQYLDDLRIYDNVLTPAEIMVLAATVPEPGTLALLALGLVGSFGIRRKSSK